MVKSLYISTVLIFSNGAVLRASSALEGRNFHETDTSPLKYQVREMKGAHLSKKNLKDAPPYPTAIYLTPVDPDKGGNVSKASPETPSAACPSCENSSSANSPIFNLRTCQIVPSAPLSFSNFRNTHLSYYWAQEITGSDLLREHLEKAPPPEDFLVAVIDNDHHLFGRHGSKVRSLISDKGPHAVLPLTEESAVSLINAPTHADLPKIVAGLKGHPPHFINQSMAWNKLIGNLDIEGDTSYYDAFKPLSSSFVIVVAAGNFFPEKIAGMLSKASEDFDVIIVGAFSPDGFVSASSQEGRQVHILAPGSRVAAAVKEKAVLFGGTSAATPQVTGALAAFKQLSGWRPPAKEAKYLLEKTATPTLHSHERPRKNGKGLLNIYKLGMTGLKLKARCEGGESGCFQKEIREGNIYKFTPDPSLTEDWNRIFPGCALEKMKKTTRQKREASCGERKEVFNKMRKTALLNPSTPRFWKALSCAYKELGFYENGRLFDKIALAGGSGEGIKAGLQSLVKKGEKSVGLLRAAEGTEGKVFALQLFNHMKTDETRPLSTGYALFAGNMGGAEGEEILEQFAADSSPYSIHVKTAAAIGAGIMGGQTSLKILKQLSEDETFPDKIEVVHAVGQTKEKDGMNILRDLLKGVCGHSETTAIAHSAMQIGGPERAGILHKILDGGPDCYETKSMIYYAAQTGGHDGAEVLLRILEERKLNCFDVDFATHETKFIGGPHGAEVLLQILDTYSDCLADDYNQLARTITLSAGHIGGPEGAGVLHKILDGDPDFYNTDLITYNAAQIGGHEGSEVLLRILEERPPDCSDMVFVAYQAGDMGGPEGAKVLLKILDICSGELAGRHKYLAKAIADNAGRIGKPEETKVLKLLRSKQTFIKAGGNY